MTYIPPCLGMNSSLFRQLVPYASAPGSNSLLKNEDPVIGGLHMMGDDDLDIYTEIHEWIERDDIAEITEDLDQEYYEDPETDADFPAQ